MKTWHLNENNQWEFKQDDRVLITLRETNDGWIFRNKTYNTIEHAKLATEKYFGG